MHSIKGLIFDMDGVLADTEPFYCRINREALQAYGIELAEETYYNFWTKQGKGLVYFLKEHKATADVQAIRKKRTELFHAYVRETVRPLPGVEKVLSELRRSYPLALVTS